MKISRQMIRRIVRECGEDMSHAPVAMTDVGVVESATIPEQELVVEMGMANQSLEMVVESLQNAAQLCTNCSPEVAAAAPMMEAMVTQAEALQEMLDAQADVLTESTGVGISEDVVEIPEEEAFAITLHGGQEGLV